MLFRSRTLRPARSLQAPEGALLSKAPPPRPRPRSRWNLNLRRAAAASVDPSVRHGEPGPQRTVPGARAACPLGAETRLHCPGAAEDRAALPGTAGAGGHGAGPAHPPVGAGTSGCGRAPTRSVTLTGVSWVLTWTPARRELRPTYNRVSSGALALASRFCGLHTGILSFRSTSWGF